MSVLSMNFTSLIAEALELAPMAFDRFFDEDQQHKLKIVRYPDLDELKIPVPSGGGAVSEEIQGVGPHKDSMLTSYLLQASHHRGLQAQNLKGQWIDCPPKDGTLVVAIGRSIDKSLLDDTDKLQDKEWRLLPMEPAPAQSIEL